MCRRAARAACHHLSRHLLLRSHRYRPFRAARNHLSRLLHLHSHHCRTSSAQSHMSPMAPPSPVGRDFLRTVGMCWVTSAVKVLALIASATYVLWERRQSLPCEMGGLLHRMRPAHACRVTPYQLGATSIKRRRCRPSTDRKLVTLFFSCATIRWGPSSWILCHRAAVAPGFRWLSGLVTFQGQIRGFSWRT